MPAGEYFLKVTGANGATNFDYTLTIDAPVGLTEDAFEENNTFATATMLTPNPLDGTAIFDNLSLYDASAQDNIDEDWFSFVISAAGQPGHFAQIEFNSSAGELDLQLYDAQHQLLRQSLGVGINGPHLGGRRQRQRLRHHRVVGLRFRRNAPRDRLVAE